MSVHAVTSGYPRLPFDIFQLYCVPIESVTRLGETYRYCPVFSISDRSSIAEVTASVCGPLLRGFWPNAVAAVVLDTASPDKLGGTGRPFDCHWIAEAREAGELAGVPPIILAGGLNPDNVAEAIRIAKPYAVDVSSGVEVAGKPGIKDAVKMRDFIQAVQGVS